MLCSTTASEYVSLILDLMSSSNFSHDETIISLPISLHFKEQLLYEGFTQRIHDFVVVVFDTTLIT
jgi:hypothetical protein